MRNNGVTCQCSPGARYSVVLGWRSIRNLSSPLSFLLALLVLTFLIADHPDLERIERHKTQLTRGRPTDAQSSPTRPRIFCIQPEQWTASACQAFASSPLVASLAAPGPAALAAEALTNEISPAEPLAGEAFPGEVAPGEAFPVEVSAARALTREFSAVEALAEEAFPVAALTEEALAAETLAVDTANATLVGGLHIVPMGQCAGTTRGSSRPSTEVPLFISVERIPRARMETTAMQGRTAVRSPGSLL